MCTRSFFSWAQERAAVIKASTLLRSAAGNFYINEFVSIFASWLSPH